MEGTKGNEAFLAPTKRTGKTEHMTTTTVNESLQYQSLLAPLDSGTGSKVRQVTQANPNHVARHGLLWLGGCVRNRWVNHSEVAKTSKGASMVTSSTSYKTTVSPAAVRFTLARISSKCAPKADDGRPGKISRRKVQTRAVWSRRR